MYDIKVEYLRYVITFITAGSIETWLANAVDPVYAIQTCGPVLTWLFLTVVIIICQMQSYEYCEFSMICTQM